MRRFVKMLQKRRDLFVEHFLLKHLHQTHKFRTYSFIRRSVCVWAFFPLPTSTGDYLQLFVEQFLFRHSKRAFTSFYSDLLSLCSFLLLFSVVCAFSSFSFAVRACGCVQIKHVQKKNTRDELLREFIIWMKMSVRIFYQIEQTQKPTK